MPGRAAADLCRIPECSIEVFATPGKGEARQRVFNFVRLLAAEQVHALLVGQFDDLIDQVADDLMTVRSNADPLTEPHQFADHMRAGKRLARAGWPLNRQYAAGQMRTQAHSGIHTRFTCVVQRLTFHARRQSQ